MAELGADELMELKGMHTFNINWEIPGNSRRFFSRKITLKRKCYTKED